MSLEEAPQTVPADAARGRALLAPLAGARAAAASLLDILLPPQCLSCRTIVAEPGLLCAACYAEARPIGAPFCHCCGVPLSGGLPEGSGAAEGGGLLCGRCLEAPPDFARARAVFAYEDVARRLLHDFKFNDRLEGRARFAAWLARAGQDLLTAADLICPVPLHYTRLIRRRYNQSALLASAVGRISGVPVALDGLVRRRRTAAQTGLTAQERVQNVRGAFAVRPHWTEKFKSAHIVLIDDVVTTGATANACAKALKAAGAAEVSVLSLARVAVAD